MSPDEEQYLAFIIIDTRYMYNPLFGDGRDGRLLP